MSHIHSVVMNGSCAVLNRLALFSKLLLVSILLSCGAWNAGAQTWVNGDVFVGVANGQYNVYSNAGVFKQTLTNNSASGYTLGCGFTPDMSKLYTLNNDNEAVEVYDGNPPHSQVNSIHTPPQTTGPLSIVFDKTGNWYISAMDDFIDVVKFSPSNSVLDIYSPDEFASWIDLAKDQSTLFYAGSNNAIDRFDLTTGTDLTDFSPPLAVGVGLNLRLLPPFDGSGGLLAVADTEVIRLDQDGNIIQTYPIPGAQGLLTLNLDPNGTSFWTGDFDTNLLYRLNLASGAVEIGPILTTTNTFPALSGVCLRGEPSGSSTDLTPPVVTVTENTPGPPEQLKLSTIDAQSGLKSIEVPRCTNCTAKTGSFAVGTNNAVITTVTQKNRAESSRVKLEATDVAGNVTVFDSVDFEIRDGGRQRSEDVEVSPTEHIVMISNGNPGVDFVEIEVDHRLLPLVDMQRRQEARIDIGPYMRPKGESSVRMTAYGREGGKVSVVITQQ
jgi:hypothetical protein